MSLPNEMKLGSIWIAWFFLIVGLRAATPGFAPFSARYGTLRIDYILPSGTHYLAGKPEEEITFSPHRSFPRTGWIAGIGWGFIKKVPQVQIHLSVLKIANPRFGDGVAPSEWDRILREEKASLPLAGKRAYVIQDSSRRDWLETVVEENGMIGARSFARPVGEDLLLLLGINFGDLVTKEQRVRGMQTLEKMLQTIQITGARP